MINAGLTLLSSGTETWVSPVWQNIKFQVNYPSGSSQNATDNPASVDDYVIDQLGQVWIINEISDGATDTEYLSSLELKSGTPSSSIVPDISGTTQGVICTPSEGGLDPWWDASYVSTAVYRKAISFSVSDFISQQPSDVKTKVVASAPDGLNTLEEIAVAINNDTNFAQNINNTINNLTLSADNITETASRKFVTDAQINQWNASSSGGINYVSTSSGYTANASDYVIANTENGSLNLTLPANPQIGTTVYLQDAKNTFETNPVSIVPNGNPINSQNDTVLADLAGCILRITFVSTVTGWSIDIGGSYNTIIEESNNDNKELKIDSASSTNQDAELNSTLYVDTSSASMTLMLPSTAYFGDYVKVIDVANQWSTNPLVVESNGPINSNSSQPYSCDGTNSQVNFVYIDSTIGWKSVIPDTTGSIVINEYPEKWRVIAASNEILQINSRNIVDTSLVSNGTTFTLLAPTNPKSGDYVVLTPGSDWSVTNITVDFSGIPLNGTSGNNLVLDTNMYNELVYIDSTTGWKVVNETVQNPVTSLSIDYTGNIINNNFRPWIIAKSSTLVKSGDNVIMNTSSGSITLTLPTSPSIGDVISFFPGSDLTVNNVTIDRNGQNINSSGSNLTISTNEQFNLVYQDSTVGWNKIDITSPIESFNIIDRYNVISSNATIELNKYYGVDTFSGPITLTLPSGVSSYVGHTIVLSPLSDWSTNNVIITDPDSSTFNGQTGDLTLDLTMKTELIRTSSGWRVV